MLVIRVALLRVLGNGAQVAVLISPAVVAYRLHRIRGTIGRRPNNVGNAAAKFNNNLLKYNPRISGVKSSEYPCYYGFNLAYCCARLYIVFIT